MLAVGGSLAILLGYGTYMLLLTVYAWTGSAVHAVGSTILKGFSSVIAFLGRVWRGAYGIPALAGHAIEKLLKGGLEGFKHIGQMIWVSHGRCACQDEN